MIKKDGQNLKLKLIAGAVICSLIFIGNKIYHHYYPTKEEQVERAALKLQKALKGKMEDELINMANELDEENQHDEDETENDTKKKEVTVKTAAIDDSQHEEKPKEQKAKNTVTTTAEDVTAFGIITGKTTEDDIRNNFDVIEEQDVVEFENHKTLILNTNSFSSAGLPVKQAFVLLNEKGIVEQLKITFNGQYFHKLHPALSKKYKLDYKDEPFVGDNIAQYSKGNTVIVLSEPHMGGFITVIDYITKEFAASVEAYNAEQKKQKEQQLQEQL